jgi:hypothetical protein
VILPQLALKLLLMGKQICSLEERGEREREREGEGERERE